MPAPLAAGIAAVVAAAKAIAVVAKSPAVRKAVVRAAQKAKDAFKKGIEKAKQVCKKIGKKLRRKKDVKYSKKIEKQMEKRGWDKKSVEETIENPSKTVPTRDTRHLPNGARADEPATAYINKDGSYIVRSDKTGDIVQVSNRNDPNWISPFGN